MFVGRWVNIILTMDLDSGFRQQNKYIVHLNSGHVLYLYIEVRNTSFNFQPHRGAVLCCAAITHHLPLSYVRNLTSLSFFVIHGSNLASKFLFLIT